MSISKSRNQLRPSLFSNTQNDLKVPLSPELKPRRILIQEEKINERAFYNCFALKKRNLNEIISKSFTINYMPLSPKQKIDHLESMETESVTRFQQYSHLFDQIKDQIIDINSKMVKSQRKRTNSIAIIPMHNEENEIHNDMNDSLIKRSITTHHNDRLNCKDCLYEEENRVDLFDDLCMREKSSNNILFVRFSNYKGGRKKTSKNNNIKLSRCTTKKEHIGINFNKESEKIFKMAKLELQKVNSHSNADLNNKPHQSVLCIIQ